MITVETVHRNEITERYNLVLPSRFGELVTTFGGLDDGLGGGGGCEAVVSQDEDEVYCLTCQRGPEPLDFAADEDSIEEWHRQL
jgi:hypothetical protein